MAYKNPEDNKEYCKQYYSEHKKRLLQYQKEYYQTNKKKRLDYMKEYEQRSKVKQRLKENRESKKERYRKDPEYRKKILEKNKEWRKNNKQKLHDYEVKRSKTEKRKVLSRRLHQEHKDERLKKQRDLQRINGKLYYQNKKCRGYFKTEVYKDTHKKVVANRKRNLGFNKKFENIVLESYDWHHIDNENVVAIPSDIHNLYKHPDTDVHRQNLEPIVVQLYPDFNGGDLCLK